MVVFTCTHCNEALKKPRVEKHFQFQCRNPISVSCIDCFQDFRGQEYVAHTKCITEAERYGGKDFVAKPGKNKGERKQQDWILVVQSVIETSQNLSSAEQNILKILSSHENVPRKKAKFFNFIKSILAGRVNMNVVESVWEKMEEAMKRASENKTTDPKLAVNQTEELCQTDVFDNENNENLSKEYNRARPGVEPNCKPKDIEDQGTVLESIGDTNYHKSNNSKKRKTSVGLGAQEEQSSNKNAKIRESLDEDSNSLINVAENGVRSKKSKKRKLDIAVQNTCTLVVHEDLTICENVENNDELSVAKFNWSDAIVKLIQSREEISLKKLKKKIISEYRTSSNKTISEDKAAAKFDKKLNKITQIVVTKGKVKLIT